MFKVIIALFVGIISVSLASILIKFTDDVPSVIITSYRLVISSLMLIFYTLIKNGGIKIKDKKEIIFAMLGGLFLSAHFIFWIASIKYTSIPSSVTLVATSPIFVGIFSYFILKEKQNKFITFGIIASVAGSAILAFADGGIIFGNLDKKSLIGDFFAILGAVAVSGYFIIGSYLRKDMNIMCYITMVYSFAALFSLLFAILSKQSFVGYKATSYIYMVLLAIVPQLIGHTSFNWALKYTKTTLVAIATLGEPVGATILAYLFFGTTLGMMQFIGIATILFAIFIASFKGGITT